MSNTATPRFQVLPPLSLYIHLPWCVRKCPYCDFNSHAAGDFDEAAYIDALIEDLQLDLPSVWGRSIHSIFIGGGTPSLFSARAIDRLLAELRACLPILASAEITLEANPGSADAENFSGYRRAGINRLSIGIQSFNDQQLLALGRVHSRQQALDAFHQARQAGFDNINLDLMYALPGQTLSQALTDLTQAIDLGVEHISHYQLTIEANTLFDSRPPANLPDDDTTWDMQQRSQQALADAGYQHYEISAYCRPRHESRHNLNYWQFGDYLGLGAGAHGKITLPAENRVIRRVRLRQPASYLQATGEQKVSETSTVQAADLVFEFMLNALRLVEGFELDLFAQHCGLTTEVLMSPIKIAEQKGLLRRANGRLVPTELGLRFHNDLQAMFLQTDLAAANRVEAVINFE
jgi:oxygen-independent coproporphyrinogen-3 oxidase